MVSFICDSCQSTLKKAKLASHACNTTFSCIDCSQTFTKQSSSTHTKCVSEAEKYEKSLYKGKRTLQTHQVDSNITMSIEEQLAKQRAEAAAKKANGTNKTSDNIKKEEIEEKSNGSSQENHKQEKKDKLYDKKSKKRKRDHDTESNKDVSKENGKIVSIQQTMVETIKSLLSEQSLTLHKLKKQVIQKKSVGDKKLSKEQKKTIEADVLNALNELNKNVKIELIQ